MLSSAFTKSEHFNPRVLYIMRRSFDSGDTTSSHTHDFLTLIYILNGQAQYEINGRIYSASSDMLFVCNPGVTHHRIVQKDQHLEEFHVGISNLCLKGLPSNHVISQSTDPVITFHQYGQAFYNTIQEILLEQQKNDEASGLMLKSIVMKLLVYIIKELYISSEAPSKNTFYLERYDKTAIVNNIIAFINDHYMKSISLAKISENTYLSPIYVSKVFKEATGESPINYLIRIRLSKACELLDNNDASITEIARMVGYEDAYYFSKLFKKYFGISPLAYRKTADKPVFKIPAI